jgi:hypothetical protein
MVIAVTWLAWQTLTKGWMSFILIFIMPFVLSGLCLLETAIFNQVKKNIATIATQTLGILLLLCVLITVTSIVGGGDTKEVFLFGIMRSTADNPIAIFSQNIFIAGYFMTFVLFAGLIGSLAISKRLPSQNEPQVPALQPPDIENRGHITKSGKYVISQFAPLAVIGIAITIMSLIVQIIDNYVH